MWNNLIKPEMLKMIGAYLIDILALIRFVVYPLQNSTAKEKIVFTEFYEAYQLKAQHLERRNLDLKKPGKGRVDKGVIVPYLYEKEMMFSAIHADVLENVIKIAEKKRARRPEF